MSQALRSNYRRSGEGFRQDAIGRAIIGGSWGGGAGDNNMPLGGGIIYGSREVVANAAHYTTDSCIELLASFYGAGHPFASMSGFMIMPFAIHLHHAQYDTISAFAVWPSITTDGSMVNWVFRSPNGSDTASDVTCGFTWAGFIVSAPF